MGLWCQLHTVLSSQIYDLKIYIASNLESTNTASSTLFPLSRIIWKHNFLSFGSEVIVGQKKTGVNSLLVRW